MFQVLEQLPVFRHPDLLVGGETADDAGVYRLDSERALVLSVDVLTPIADDPYVFGQIAAANSLSDVYAMGGVPLAALCIVGYPVGEVPHETIRAMLAGVWDKVREAGAVVAGGHTTKDLELRCGLSVTGLVHPERVLTNAGARPGDALVLTKPLGSGIIATALRANLATPESVREANAAMAELNRAAATVAHEVEAHAATDITGFGLLGHAWEMAQASNVDLVIEGSAVPLLSGVWELAAQELFAGGSVRNYDFIHSRADFAASVAPDLCRLLCDAQTSGGLLIAVPPQKAGDSIARLRDCGVGRATIVGHVRPGPGRVRVL